MVCLEHYFTQTKFYRWKKKYREMGIADSKRLKELEKRSGEVKEILAEFMIIILVLEEVNAKKCP